MGGGLAVVAEVVTENADLPPPLAAWAADKGYGNPERILGGRNNRIFKLCGPSGSAALKVYYRGAGDRRDRFAAERDFYAIAGSRGVAAPQLLASDQHLGVSLLNWIDGAPIAASIESHDVSAAARFLVGVNEPVPADRDAPLAASEACFSISDHMELLHGRIAKLSDATRKSPPLRDFVDATLLPFVARARRKLEADDRSEFRSSGWRSILSPGDFGLHNALRDKSGRVVFFDFEYSGWDDPVKTVADVFLQPEKPVPWSFLPGFCAQLQAWPGLDERVRIWLPFFAAKWALILVGPAARDAAERRRFAGDETDEAKIKQQISKARDVMERVENFLG